MSTLAGDFVKAGQPRLSGVGSKALHALQDWTFGFVMVRLLAPLPTGDVRLNANQYAERYVFDEDAPMITTNLVRSGAIDADLIWQSVRLPAQNVWIEYPLSKEAAAESGIIRVGFMIGQIATGENETVVSAHRTAMAIVAKTENAIGVVGLMSVPEIRPIAAHLTHIHTHWFLDTMSGEGVVKEHDQDILTFFRDVIGCLFLVNTPRVSEMRTGSFGHRKAKVRQGKEGIPFIEYRRVTLKVGVAKPRYEKSDNRNPDPASSAEASRRKLHRCIGHFRTYREGRNTPHVQFIPEHWRGDPALGIILHERVVKK